MKRRTAALALSAGLLAGCGGAASSHGAATPSATAPATVPTSAARLAACAKAINTMQAAGDWGPQGLQGPGAAEAADPADCQGFPNGDVIAEMGRLFPGNCGTTGNCPAPKGN